VNNERSGKGRHIKENGDIYTGTFLNNTKEGRGEYYYKSSNRVYVGEWAKDVPRCGIFMELDDEKTLPQLQVKDVDKILKQSILKVRQIRQKERVQRLAMADVVFTEEELIRFQEKFKAHLTIGSLTITMDSVLQMLDDEHIPYKKSSMNELRQRQFGYHDFLVLASAGRDY